MAFCPKESWCSGDIRHCLQLEVLLPEEKGRPIDLHRFTILVRTVQDQVIILVDANDSFLGNELVANLDSPLDIKERAPLVFSVVFTVHFRFLADEHQVAVDRAGLRLQICLDDAILAIVKVFWCTPKIMWLDATFLEELEMEIIFYLVVDVSRVDEVFLETEFLGW